MRLTDVLRRAETIRWSGLFEKAAELAKVCTPVARDIRYLDQQFPHQLIGAWFCPATDELSVYLTKNGDVKAWQQELKSFAFTAKVAAESVNEVPDMTMSEKGQQTPVVSVAEKLPAAAVAAERPPYYKPFRTLLRLGGFVSDSPNPLPGWPSPAAAMLSSGLIGATLGYGGGTLLSWLLPSRWDRERVPRNWAIIGGLLGAAPGFGWALSNWANNKSIFSGTPINTPPVGAAGAAENLPYRAPYKETSASYGVSSLWEDATTPTINVPQFVNTVWHDPAVAGPLTPREQALAAGLARSAATVAGDSRPAKWVSPLDVAKISGGMGAGYLSGLLVGKVFGALTGMPEKEQDKLKQTGMWAGAISSALPLVFQR